MFEICTAFPTINLCTLESVFHGQEYCYFTLLNEEKMNVLLCITGPFRKLLIKNGQFFIENVLPPGPPISYLHLLILLLSKQIAL